VDFHPTDVLPDADGSLLVVDTGGWYRLCCPSSQLAKPDVLGAVYRVRKTGASRLAQADRKAAYARLIRPTLAHGNATVGMKQAAQQRDPALTSRMLALLAEKSATVATSDTAAGLVRVAAEGLGRLREKRAVPPLLRATGFSDDAVLQHSLIYALIEIADPTTTRAGLKDFSAKIQRAALIALNEMDGSDLKPTEVTPFLSATDEPLRTAASWILGRHPEWAGELAGWFREQLTATNAVAAQLESLNARLPILTHAAAGQELLADAITRPAFRPATRVAALGAIANADLENRRPAGATRCSPHSARPRGKWPPPSAPRAA